MRGRIEIAPPFDFELSLRLACRAPLAVAAREWTPAPDHWHGREYRRVVNWTGQPALLRVRNCGVVDRPAIEWRIDGASAKPSRGTAEPQAEALGDRVRRMFSADVDLAACYAAFASDPVLGPLTERFHGLRVLRFPSLFECLANTILEQQLNFWFASLVKRRLIETFGPAVEFEGRRYHGYPAPETLAQLQPAALRPLQISAPKARALNALAQAVEKAGSAEELLWSTGGPMGGGSDDGGCDPEAACERLMRLRGIGRWSAEYALLRGAGATDALPAADVGLQRSVRLLYGLRAPVTPLALRRRWRKLAPWRGYAAYYVWLTQWA